MFRVIERHIEELSALLTSEHGHPAASAKWEIEWLTKLYGPALHQMDLPDEESEMKQVGHVVKRYLPLGVVCAISPWNLPVLLSFVKVLPALLTGNTVVLKPSPFTPLTVLRIADYVNHLLPAGVLNVVTGGDDLGQWMTSHPAFDKIAFTGSKRIGKEILKSAAATLKHVTLDISQSAAKQMLRQQSGHIVNISTSVVDQPIAGAPCALQVLSKAGLHAVARALAIEYAGQGIRINTVALGAIRTPMHKIEAHDFLKSLQPIGRMGEIDEVVDAVMYLNDATFVTGEAACCQFA